MAQWIKFSLTAAALGGSAFGLVSCATVSELPQSADKVEFTSLNFSTPDNTRASLCHVYPGLDTDTAFLAAQYALRSNNFLIKRSTLNEGTVIGHHGFTSTHWNQVAGIYFRDHAQGVAVDILVQGSAANPSSRDRQIEALALRATRISEAFESFSRSQVLKEIEGTECR